MPWIWLLINVSDQIKTHQRKSLNIMIKAHQQVQVHLAEYNPETIKRL